MKDQKKTKAQLIRELSKMRERVLEMEALEAEHKRAEERIGHLNAVLRAIRNVNQLITKEKDLGRLLHGICDNLVQNRGYLNVWIALLDEFKGLVATAEAGLGSAFQPIVERLRRGMFMGCGQKALARSGVVVTGDPFSECEDCPLAAEYGGRGAMTVRLEFEGNVYGLLAVSVPRHLALDEEEQGLFREVAEDIAFALRNIELEEGRKLAGESLRLSAAYARNLIETSLDPLVTIDEEGKITDVNAAAEAVTGCSREELMGTEFSGYFTDPGEVKEAHQKAFSQGSVRDCELEIRHRDGVVTPVLYNASVYLDETGKVAGVVAAARDVTEWKKAEQALKESEARYRALFEKSADGIVVADMETKKFIYANPAICEMLGYTEQELTQIHIHDIHPKEALGYVSSEFEIQISGERPLSRDMPCLKKDGTVFYADVNAGAVVVNGRKCSMGFFRDTTERRQAEEALKDSEARYRVLFETSVDGLLVAERETKKFIYANSAICRMLGYTEEELTRLGVQDIHPKGEEMDYALAELESEEEGQRVLERDVACLRKDGTLFYVNLSGGRAVVDGKDCNVGFFKDITERKKAEEALKDSEARYRAVFENISSGVALYEAVENGADFVFKDFNAAGEKIDKVKREQLIGKSVCEVFPRVKDFGLFNVFQRVWETGESEFFPLRLYQGENVSGWRENFVCKLPSGEIVAVYDDVTARKEAEEALKKSEEKYRALLANIPDVVWTADFNGKTVFVSPNVEKVYGFTQKEMLQDEKDLWFGRIHPDDLGGVRRALADLFDKGKVFDVEHRVRRKDGEWLWIRDRAITVYEHDGTLYADGMFSDITDRKKAGEALKESEELFRTLFEAAPIGLILTRPSSGVVVSCNQKGAELFGGSSPDDFIGRKAIDFYENFKDRSRMVAAM